MVLTISPAECTEAHVYEHIQELEDQACEELGNEISFGKLPAPFDMRRTEEGLYDCQRDMKEDYLPAIHMALGIRHYLRHDSAEDVALAEANSLKWYYVAIRPKQDLFTVIKYRSPKPCHAFVLQMAGLEDAYHESRCDEDEDEAYDVFVPCGTLETTNLFYLQYGATGKRDRGKEAVWSGKRPRGQEGVYPAPRRWAQGVSRKRGRRQGALVSYAKRPT